MNTIGIRVKPGEVTFAVFDTERNELSNIEAIKIPKALPTPDALKYVRNNILDVLREYDVSQAGLSAQRIQQIRQRIRSGFYDSEEVIDAVARRILDSAEFRG